MFRRLLSRNRSRDVIRRRLDAAVERLAADTPMPAHVLLLDEPVDYWPVDSAPARLPANLYPMPGRDEVAYDPATGALVKVPTTAHRLAEAVAR